MTQIEQPENRVDPLNPARDRLLMGSRVHPGRRVLALSSLPGLRLGHSLNQALKSLSL
jgi:hypothetical protein